ncbi:MAG: hypothetical protein IPG61_08605 [bacterium]|nr:hypothetical protein [bacterium]
MGRLTGWLLLWLVAVAAGQAYRACASDEIALWFDAEGEVPCQLGAPFVPVTLYVVLLDPTFSQLYGWEAAVHSAGDDIFVIGSTVLSGGTDSDAGVDLRVAYAEPLAVGAKTVLATVMILPTAPEACLILTGASTPTLPVPGPIVWASADTPAEIATANVLSNGVDAILGSCVTIPEIPYVSCTNAVAVEQPSWGSFKSMYR